MTIEEASPPNRYDNIFAEKIESYWQKYWEEKKLHQAPDPKSKDFDASKEKFYVIDLLVADISLIVTKRSEFNSMLKKVDYELEELNLVLKNQNKSSYSKLIN